MSEEHTVEELSLKFPAILKEKLRSSEIIWPKGTQFDYNPIEGFRCVARNKDDNNEITRNDFKSYAEENRKTTRGQIIDKSSPEYYGVSLYRKKEIVENVMRFPRHNRKIAQGLVFCEGGPQKTIEETEHITWWLYDEADLSGFVIISEGEKNEK